MSTVCSDASKSYFLEITINGEKQSPRRRLTAFNFLRKNVNETTMGTITIANSTVISPTTVESHYIKAKTGLKELNKDLWKLKLLYASELANTTLAAQEELALTQINTAKNISIAVVGESIELKKARLNNAAELAKELIDTNTKIARAKIGEARELALLNGETEQDRAEIEEEARLKEIALNLTMTEKKRIVDVELNISLAEIEANDDGIRFCLSDGTNCMSVANGTNGINGSQGIQGIPGINGTDGINGSQGPQGIQGIPGVNGSQGPQGIQGPQGEKGDSLAAGGDYLYNDSTSIYLNETKLNNAIDARATTLSLTNYALKNQSETFAGNITTTQIGFFGWLGSLTSRITKLWVVDINATGNIETSQNVSAKYFKGDGSLLTNLPAGGGETDPVWAANSSTVARTGNCPAGQVVQNTTTVGVQCMAPSAGAESDPKWSANFTNMQTDCPSDNYAYGINGNGMLKCRQDQTGSGGGLTPAYLGSDLTATSAGYTTIFTIALTPSKMNVIQAYLAQSSSTNGVAIQNRANISESGPTGICHFVTQTQAGAQVVDNIAVSTNSADTGTTAMGLDINVPFINTVTCTVLADANQRNLIIQFDSENANTVTTHAGSYYTNAVN